MSEQRKQKEQEKPWAQEIQSIADKIKNDVEQQLNQAFKKFKVMDYQCLADEKNEPERTSLKMKVNTDESDKNLSHVKLWTTRRDQWSDWVTNIEEFFNARSPFDNLLCCFDSSQAGCNSIQSLADRIQKDVEKELNRSFNVFDVADYHPILTDPENTSYYMRVKTDDNGYVRVKTIKKAPGSDWQTHVEEYQRGKPSLEGEKKKGIEGERRAEPTRQQGLEGKGKERMEVEQGQQQSKGTSV